jgi:hypothetical protein
VLGASLRRRPRAATGPAGRLAHHVARPGVGLELYVDEVVVRYEPPLAKAWETVADVRLLVIGHYRMKIELEPTQGGSRLQVTFDWQQPETHAWLGSSSAPGTRAGACAR